jgi:hypothetical protein
MFMATVLVGLWCLSPRFWLVCGVYRHGFGWFVMFMATVLVGLWCLSPRFWLVCGVYRHGFGWFVVFIATFNNISVIYNVSSTSRHERGSNSQL